MSKIRLTPAKFARSLIKRAGGITKAVDKGIETGAHRGMAILVARTPSGATSKMRQSWSVNGKGRRVEIHNDAPYAGIVEKGARPHPVNEEGIAAITHWARRKLGLNAVDAEGLAQGVAWKLRRKGQKPTHFVRDSMDDLRDALADEVARELKKVDPR